MQFGRLSTSVHRSPLLTRRLSAGVERAVGGDKAGWWGNGTPEEVTS